MVQFIELSKKKMQLKLVNYIKKLYFKKVVAKSDHYNPVASINKLGLHAEWGREVYGGLVLQLTEL